MTEQQTQELRAAALREHADAERKETARSEARPDEAQPGEARRSDDSATRYERVIVYLLATLAAACVAWLSYEAFQLSRGGTPAVRAEGGKPPLDAAARALSSSDEALRVLRQDAKAVQAGTRIFSLYCASCHGANGAGGVGPNLTDKAWLHGGNPRAIFESIAAGVPAKGMPGWEAVLGTADTRQVTAFVLSLRNAGITGRAPQGDEYAGE